MQPPPQHTPCPHSHPHPYSLPPYGQSDNLSKTPIELCYFLWSGSHVSQKKSKEAADTMVGRAPRQVGRQLGAVFAGNVKCLLRQNIASPRQQRSAAEGDCCLCPATVGHPARTTAPLSSSRPSNQKLHGGSCRGRRSGLRRRPGDHAAMQRAFEPDMRFDVLPGAPSRRR